VSVSSHSFSAYKQTLTDNIYGQDIPVSCAAASLVVIEKELLGEKMTDEKEKKINDRVYTSPIGSLPTEIYNYIDSKNGLFGKFIGYKEYNLSSVNPESLPMFQQIIENEEKRLLELKKDGELIKIRHGTFDITKLTRKLLRNDNLRVMIMVVIDGWAMHWIVLRGHQGEINVMDPLYGTNIKYSQDEFGKKYAPFIVGGEMHIY
jgi:hypothetical protein